MPASLDQVNVESSYALPVSGIYVMELQCFDQAMLEFMGARSIQAGTITVTKDRVLMLARGYGWQDRGHTQVISSNSLMRIASNDKPITSAVIKKLIREGHLSAETKAFSYLDISPPPGQTPDPRLADITVQHLLDHQGGWDHHVANFDPVEIAEALGIPPPAYTLDMAKYTAGQPLQFTPGTQTVYCNFGYALLRVIAERASGIPFVTYLQCNFNLDVKRSYAFPEDRDPREIWYSHPDLCQNVYDPSNTVPCPDGGYVVSSRTVIASGTALVSFLDQYWISGSPRDPDHYTGYRYWYFGSMPGTRSFTYQASDGVNIAVLFNQRKDPSGLDYGLIKEAMDGALAEVQQWPDGPPCEDTPAVFRVQHPGEVLADGAFYAPAFETGAADIAEWVWPSESVEPGDVVEFDPVSAGQYRVAQNACSSLVAGVISTTPGVTLGTDLDASDKALLALIGIVPVKVTNEGGSIQPGDLLVTSSTPGRAMRWASDEPCPCSLVGKALEPMTDEAGIILVLLTAH